MHPIQRKTSKYPLDMYLNYVQSVGTAVERRLMDLTPAKEEVFWGWFREEIEIAEYRMKTCSRQVRKIASPVRHRSTPITEPVRQPEVLPVINPK